MNEQDSEENDLLIEEAHYYEWLAYIYFLASKQQKE